MTLEGKGMYIWKIRSCEGGDVDRIASLAQQAGLSHILIKIADGGYSYNYDYGTKTDLVPALVDALRSRGVSPWGWHYVRGEAPTAEARKSIERMRDLDLDGLAIDAEAEYKGRQAAAKEYMDLLRKDLPNTPIGLSSYRYPAYHPTLPWKEFLTKCDLNMPQVYWEGAHNPALQLERCIQDFKQLEPERPIVPTGAAYQRGSWIPAVDEMGAFLDEARRQHLSGANFWEWSTARSAGLWAGIADYDWGGSGGPTPAPPQVRDIVDEYLAALNTRRPDSVIALYKPDAIHVSAERTAKGTGEIIGWYANLLVISLPEATFRLTGYSGSGSSRHFTWTAESSKGRVVNGNDIFGLFDDKIGFHYTFFTVN